MLYLVRLCFLGRPEWVSFTSVGQKQEVKEVQMLEVPNVLKTADTQSRFRLISRHPERLHDTFKRSGQRIRSSSS